jgi:hypothetical protein
MTPSGIEPATFRFVAQYLNHCATISGPLYGSDMIRKIIRRRLKNIYTEFDWRRAIYALITGVADQAKQKTKI